MSAKRTSPRGFTLVEVLLAGIVMAIASVGLSASMIQASRLGSAPREDVAARNAIRDCIAEMAATPFDRVAETYQDHDFDVTGLRVAPGDPDGHVGKIHFEYGPDGSTLYYTVTVRIHWMGRNGDRVEESVHYLSNVRGDTGTPLPLEQLGERLTVQ